MKNTPNLLDLYEAIKPKYIIFCDMDGVLVDFDKGYNNLTGKPTNHNDVQDKYEYWVNLPWMSDGMILWNYIKKFTPYILTAPSRDPGSKQGKIEWANRLDGMKNIYFKPAYAKAEYSKKNRILIDDKSSTIEQWNQRGGIGILHTSTTNTIKQLQQLEL